MSGSAGTASGLRIFGGRARALSGPRVYTGPMLGKPRRVARYRMSAALRITKEALQYA